MKNNKNKKTKPVTPIIGASQPDPITVAHAKFFAHRYNLKDVNKFIEIYKDEAKQFAYSQPKELEILKALALAIAIGIGIGIGRIGRIGIETILTILS